MQLAILTDQATEQVSSMLEADRQADRHIHVLFISGSLPSFGSLARHARNARTRPRQRRLCSRNG